MNGSSHVAPKGGEGGVAGSAADVGTSGQAGGRKKTAWMTHVKATMRANKGMKLMQVLKMAKKTYKKGMRGGAVAGGLSPLPLSGGRRRRGTRKTRRSRRGGYEM